MRKALSLQDQVIVQPFTTKYLSPTLVTSKQLFAAPMVVIVSDDLAVLGTLHSSVHDIWVRKYSSKMVERIRYSSSDCFKNFPFPSLTSHLRLSSSNFYECRQLILKNRGVGVTSALNLLHCQDNQEQDIQNFRKYLIELDRSVVDGYGWQDIELAHGYYETRVGIRFAISENNKKVLLERLLDLNAKRYNERVEQAPQILILNRRKPRLSNNGHQFADRQNYLLFDDGSYPNGLAPQIVVVPILEWLRANTGWHSKDSILRGTGIPDARWKSTIKSLLSDSSVERQGEKRGVRYRAVTDGAKG